ncbi:2-oxoglutarate dehydrogenase E1 subunit family protein, partial [Angustibacter aerolatus]
MAQESTNSDPMAAFGPNEWLVDELYQQYREDKTKVDRAWWGFFADYSPGDAVEAAPSGAKRANGAQAAATPPAPPLTEAPPAAAASPAPAAPPAPPTPPAPPAPA